MRTDELQTSSQIMESQIWQSGDSDLESYYVYGLTVTNDRKILAFAEGRVFRRDKDPHHIVYKISRDNGKSWSANNFAVKSETGETFSNPTPVYNPRTGQIFLFYARNYANEATDVFVKMTSNAGHDWSSPECLTHLFIDNLYNWTLHLPGPGHGLQLLRHAGRLILPVWHRGSLKVPASERHYGISIIYSDDDGTTWRNGGIIPPGTAQLNESRLVELANGDLLLNARSGAFVNSPRYLALSRDGGLTWLGAQEIKSLPPAFATDSSFISVLADSGEILIFIRPRGLNMRKDLSIYQSFDAGVSWHFGETIYAGAAGYSDAVLLPNGELGLIYGRDLLEPDGDVEGNVQQTIFARFNPARLRGN